MSEDRGFTVDSGRSAAECGELEQWVTDFLSSPGSDNGALAVKLTSPTRWWHGPVKLPLGELSRLAGPSDEPVLVSLEDEDLERVGEMEVSLEEGWDPPPLIVSFRDGELILEDGNHRLEGMRRSGATDGWSIVCFDERSELESFVHSRG